MKKKFFVLVMVVALVVSLTACVGASAAKTAAPDYSKKDSWCRIPEITKNVDTFFIYPTEYMGFNEGDPDYATLDNAEMRAGAEGDYILQASAYADATNVFMPFYRQSSLRHAGDVWKATGNNEGAFSGIPYDDIVAALDYYFENCNNGRPFILAAHSQGSAIAKLVLKKYFKEHPDYYKRMVAAYVIGFAVTKDELEANPHLKFATGESDTGVIVSWNTEGPKNMEQNVMTAMLLPNDTPRMPLRPSWTEAASAAASPSFTTANGTPCQSCLTNSKTGAASCSKRSGGTPRNSEAIRTRLLMYTPAALPPMASTRGR